MAQAVLSGDRITDHRGDFGLAQINDLAALVAPESATVESRTADDLTEVRNPTLITLAVDELGRDVLAGSRDRRQDATRFDSAREFVGLRLELGAIRAALHVVFNRASLLDLLEQGVMVADAFPSAASDVGKSGGGNGIL